MALNDPLANVMSKLVSFEKVGKKEVLVSPSSKLIKKILDILNDHNYIGKYKTTKYNWGELITIPLLSKINNCGVIKPRFSVKKDNFEKFEKRFFPARDFGIIIVSTSKGIMTHKEAIEKKIGGKLLAYIY